MELAHYLLTKWMVIIYWKDALRLMLSMMDPSWCSSRGWHYMIVTWTSWMMTLWSVCIWIILIRWWKTVRITINVCKFIIQSKHFITFSSNCNTMIQCIRISTRRILYTSSQDIKWFASKLLLFVIKVITMASLLFLLFCCLKTSS